MIQSLGSYIYTITLHVPSSQPSLSKVHWLAGLKTMVPFFSVGVG